MWASYLVKEPRRTVCGCRQQTRDEALLLVGVVPRHRRIEVPEKIARHRARVFVAAVLRHVQAQPIERSELFADALVTCAEHRQRVVGPAAADAGSCHHEAPKEAIVSNRSDRLSTPRLIEWPGSNDHHSCGREETG